MPNVAALKMQNPLAIPALLAFSTQKSPTRFLEDPSFHEIDSFGLLFPPNAKQHDAILLDEEPRRCLSISVVRSERSNTLP
jgi:hypothetical protein